jgi:signal transduction histidine kinase
MSIATQGMPDHARRIEEFGKIILAYSEVTERLQQSHDQLLTTVEQLRNELSDKNRQLERRKRLAALGEMAAGLAHEIRNPLGGIQLYASMLESDLRDRPGSCEVARKISSGVRRLEGLVSQVLQFSGQVVPQLEDGDIGPVVKETVEFLVAQAQERGVELRCRVPGGLPCRFDPKLIGQAVMNLVLNGIQAADRGGRVQVIVRRGNPGVRLFVRDTGPGIAPEHLDRIFNPFFTTRDSGTGLGLAIVHRIVEAHDGSIVARNHRSGRGAVFEVRL